MSRRSLRPQLNQIRGWVRQGRTDAWIAHQLEVTVQQIQAFKREHGLEPDGDGEGNGSGSHDEVDLRAEDDAAIAAELEAEEARREEERKAEEARAAEEAAAKAAEAEASEEAEPEEKPKRRARAPAPAQARVHGAARGHVRPRRGGLRAVARSRCAGRSRLRRALGRAPPGRGHDRGGPDRDPPCRLRRRGRQRLTLPAGATLHATWRSRGGTSSTRRCATGSSRGLRARSSGSPTSAASGTSIWSAWRHPIPGSVPGRSPRSPTTGSTGSPTGA